jgi:hypothetical protein
VNSRDPRSFKLGGCKEDGNMARFVLRGSILKQILIVVFCMLGSACVQTPVALAQHRGGHTGGGGAHGFAPPISHPTISRPRALAGRPLARAGTPDFRFQRSSTNIFRRRAFFGAPFFGFGESLGFNSFWWPTCGPFWGWGWGFDCYALPFYGYGFENYVTASPPRVEYAYPLGAEERELVWLYLKDGTVYRGSDYWFVNGRIHFNMVEEGGAKSVEQVIDFDKLDLQRIIDVNTRRGFRMVMRDEPWQQYLRDHPDLTPPDLQPPKEN